MISEERTRETEDATRAAGALLTAPGLAVLAAVLVLAAWFGQGGILLLAGLFLATAGFARLWTRLALAGVRAERRLPGGNRTFAGGRIACELKLVNRKPMPLPWVRLEDRLPPALRTGPAGETQAGALVLSAALLWYRSVRWKLELDCARRGFYALGPLRVSTGDLLGLYSRSTLACEGARIIVYPRVFPVDTGRIRSRHPMGSLRTARRLFQDPTHTIGVRGYERSDSPRLIHWKATARRGELQVRMLAATRSFQVGLFLDAASFPAEGPEADADFELGLSAAASIAAALSERGSPTGLFVNAKLADNGQPTAIPPGAGKSRLVDILEALAKVLAVPTGPLAPFVEVQRAKLPAGTTLVFIVAQPPQSLAALVSGLQASGFAVQVLTIGAHAAPRLPARTPWQRVTAPSDLGPASAEAA